MTFSSLLKSVGTRLDEADRGDHGWWVITRVHLTTARLRDIAIYLLDVGAGGGRELTRADYRSIGRLVEVGGSDPGVQLRRHQFLAMEKPLRLIERTDGTSWNSVTLTSRGIVLATSPDPAVVMEDLLSEIVFCAEPFYTPARIDAYSDFAVAPYTTTLEVLGACDGWIDRDEFDLFLSRVRVSDEIAWAIDGIRAFRTISDQQRTEVLAVVKSRTPGRKIYQNWRDMGPHHFSLFGLGTSAIRDGNRLVLSTYFLHDVKSDSKSAPHQTPALKVTEGVKSAAQPRSLKIPEPNVTDELAAPPMAPALNGGTDAEILVGKLLQAAGWDIVYYGAKRGYGFDIWARKADAAMVIEVKSSLGQLGTINLTQMEYAAAQHHGLNFVLALVEGIGENPKVRFVNDPASNLVIQEKSTATYVVPREAWDPIAEESWA